jgi:hypothetical protein
MDLARWRTRSALIALTMALAACQVGCVKRRYTIRTDPPGALVFVNGEEAGTSPVSRTFTFYGDREIILQADGYETQKIIQPLDAPWWDNGLTDFVSENLLPATLRDERTFDFRMAPTTNPETPDVLNRAENVRRVGLLPPLPQRRTILQWLGLRRSD